MKAPIVLAAHGQMVALLIGKVVFLQELKLEVVQPFDRHGAAP
jgi:hypothetical protein